MKTWGWVALFVLGLGQPAMAITEDFVLTKMLWEEIRQSKALAEILSTARESTAFARDTATFARESVQVAKNLRTLMRDPSMFLGMTVASMHNAFPELHETLANAYSVRESLTYISNPRWLPEYDPYAYYRGFNAVTNATTSTFDVATHVVDFWKISEAHDQQMEVLRAQQQAAYDHLNQLASKLNSTGVSPLQMQVETAKSTALSAASQAQAAATLDRLLLISQLQWMHAASAQTLAHAQRTQQDTYTAHSAMRDWRLTPLRPRHAWER